MFILMRLDKNLIIVSDSDTLEHDRAFVVKTIVFIS